MMQIDRVACRTYLLLIPTLVSASHTYAPRSYAPYPLPNMTGKHPYGNICNIDR